MMAKAGGEPMQLAFSYGVLEKLLEKHGFLIYELLQNQMKATIIQKQVSALIFCHLTMGHGLKL